MPDLKRVWLLLLFLLLVLTGCGSPAREEDQGPVGKLWGKVSFNGKKVLLGKVIALSDEGRKGYGEIFPDGIYFIEKAPAGKVRLFLELPPVPPELATGGPHGLPQPPLPPGAPKPVDPAKDMEADFKKGFQSIANIPLSYTRPDTSGLQCDVKEAKETNFNLKLVARPN